VPLTRRSPTPTRTPDSRVAMMDDAGVQWQILSIPPSRCWGTSDTVRWSAWATTRTSAWRALSRPVQIYMELPLPYLDASLAEFERCRNELGIDAVNILASHGEVSAVAGEFEAGCSSDQETETACSSIRGSAACAHPP